MKNIIYIILAILASCTIHRVIDTPIAAQTTPLIKDTVVLLPPSKKLTQTQLSDYLRQQYKLNYDLFLSPENQQLRESISRLSKSVFDLTNNINLRQKRTDSIVKERNFWRANSLQQKDSTSYYQKLALASQKELLAGQKLAAKQSDTQIEKLNKVVNYILVGGVLITSIMVVMAIAVFILWKSNKELYKKITNA
jgi:hypothetical protein